MMFTSTGLEIWGLMYVQASGRMDKGLMRRSRCVWVCVPLVTLCLVKSGLHMLVCTCVGSLRCTGGYGQRVEHTCACSQFCEITQMAGSSRHCQWAAVRAVGLLQQ